MALILRIASTDGKDVIEKEVSKLPSKIKVPPGAKVFVIDTDTDIVWSLAAFINQNTGTDNEQLPPYVEVEEVSDWAAAGDWLASIGDPGRPWEEPGYYTPGSRDEDSGVLGVGSTPLIVGGLLLGGGGAALALAGGGSGSDGGTDNPAVTTPSALALAAVSDTGEFDDDGVTSISQGLIIIGAADAGDEIAIRSGGTTLATGVAGDNGTFAIAVNLAEGTHEITALARNADGEVSGSSEAITIEVDTTAPGAVSNLDLGAEDDKGPSSTDNITNVDVGITISGTAPVGESVALFDEGGNVLGGDDEVTQNGNFEVDLALEDGTYNIIARSVDLAGNIGPASAPLTLVIDTVAPEAPSMPDLAAEDDDGVSDSDDRTSQTTGLTISGTTEPNAVVSLFDGGVLLRVLTADENGNYSTDFDLDVDNYVIRAQVMDVAGNISAQSLPLELSVVDIV